jgi:hypothetical protein
MSLASDIFSALSGDISLTQQNLIVVVQKLLARIKLVIVDSLWQEPEKPRFILFYTSFLTGSFPLFYEFFVLVSMAYSVYSVRILPV